MPNSYTIQSGGLTVTVSSLGAEMISVKTDGRERLWQNQNGEWSGHAPVLFPVCGGCTVTVGGEKHTPGAHGFARKREFELVGKTGNSAEFSLCSDGGTLKLYPYDFELRVRYVIADGSVEISYTVINPSDTSLPFSCGGHESFVLNSGVENYKIVFEKEEKLVHHFHGDGGLLDGRTHDYGVAKEFVLPAEFLQEGRTLIFPDINSRSVDLVSLDGEKEAHVEFAGFKNLLLWRAGCADMICIEPWGNLPDREGAADREFTKKAGWTVPPHESKTLIRKITYFFEKK